MSKLDEAKRRYKKGDVVRSTYGNEREFDNGLHFFDEQHIFAQSSDGIDLCIYDADTDRWAEIISRAEFTQDDIKSGMKIQYRDGDYRLVTEFNGELFLSGYTGQSPLSDYENLSNFAKILDIVKVIKPTNSFHQMFSRLDEGEVVWEEKQEIPEYTVEELQDKLGIKFKIKAND